VAEDADEEGDKPSWMKKLQKRENKVEEATQQVKETVEELLPKYLAEAKALAGQTDAASMQANVDKQLGARINGSVAALKHGLVERDTEVRLMLLATLCGEHLLLLGPPGTAKSELSRRLSKICQGQYFERLLTRFSVPEELFGPLSMKGLEEDRFERKITGYLPVATVAFIDEIFKANSAILNSLLSILNERVFDNGSERIDVPLICMVGASNELPESEELDALYDRFLLRRNVSQVSSENISQLLNIAGSEGSVDGTTFDDLDLTDGPIISLEELRMVRNQALAVTKVPQDIVDLLGDMRTFLQEKCEPPIYVSDRRLVKTVSMLRVMAFTCGRTEVNEYDCLMLQHTMWQRPEEADIIRDWVLDRIAVDKGTNQVSYLLNGVFRRACQAQRDSEKDIEACKVLQRETIQLREVLIRQLGSLADTGDGTLPVLRDHLWLSQSDIIRSTQTLSPMLKKARQSLEKLLQETLTLEVSV